MSDNKNSELMSALLEVQQELSHAKASATNPHFKSQYVPFEELWDYAKEHLNSKGILIQQMSHECEVGACIEMGIGADKDDDANKATSGSKRSW